MLWIALIAAVVLAAVHVFAGKIRFLRVLPRSRWLSMAGGASVAYVFVHLLPELDEHQEHFSDIAAVSFVEHHVYLITLTGFAAFYGLERLARRGRQADAAGEVEGEDHEPHEGHGSRTVTSPGVFWIHIASFGLYNLLIGYLLLHRETPGTGALTLYAAAMALHFLVNDYGLHEHHKRRYRDVGRWLLAIAVLAGWGLGTTISLSQTLIGVLFAFIGGGVILNVIKEELPEERASRWWAFTAGAAAYTLIVLAEGWTAG